MADCFDKFLKNSPGDKSRNQKLLEEIEDIAQDRAETDTTKTLTEHRIEVIEEFQEMEDARLATVEARFAASRRARNERLASMNGLAFDAGLNTRDALLGVVDTVAARVNGERKRRLSLFERDLKEKGLARYLRTLHKNRQEELNVMMELEQLNRENGTPGVSGSESALEFARLYQHHYDAINASLDQMGAGVKRLEGRIARNIWERESLQRFTRGSDDPAEFFAEAMVDRVDWKRTVGEEATRIKVRDFLKKFYEERTDMNVRKDIPLTVRELERQRTTSTFAERQLEHREIHLRGPEDFQFMVDNFSSGTFASVLSQALERQAGKAELTRGLGINPRNTVDFLENEARRIAKKRGDMDKLGGGLRGQARETLLNGMLRVADGQEEVDVSSPELSKIGASLRSFSNSVLLGKVILLTPTEFVTSNVAQNRLYRAAGKSNVELGRRIMPSIKRLTREMDKETTNAIRMALDLSHGYTVNASTRRLSTGSKNDVAFNFFKDAENLQYDVTGLNSVTAGLKTKAGITASATLSAMRGRAFADLDRTLQELILDGGMTPENWDRVRQIDSAFTDVGTHGYAYLDLRKLNVEDPDLARDWESILRRFANQAVITAGPLERGALNLNTQAGTFAGEGLRSLTQLLGWPIAIWTRGINPEIRSNGTTGLAALGVKLLVAGYVSTMLNDVVEGRARDPLSTDLEAQRVLLLESLARGGFGGVVADMFVRSIDPIQGKGPFGSLMGAPAFSLLDSGITGGVDVIQAAVSGDLDKAGMELFETGTRITPGSNIPPFNFLLTQMQDHLHQSLNQPGQSRFTPEGAELIKLDFNQ